ncbi:MAG: peptidyl-prolyl cis-trans isomerase [Caulobacterales bacterium]|nr:peptidyl-prolyl cis-trans isomerase [Caulobacterales bacterium]
MSPRGDGPAAGPVGDTQPSHDSALRRSLRRIAAEPLVHFLIIGAVLFAGLSLAKSLERPVVRIDAQDLNQLAAYWELQMQRPPNKAELAGIINERIDEELLAREALRLGLDKGDMIIRRRLAQKMSFATDDVAAAREPTEAELRAFYARTASRYAAPARVSFQQVFFSGDRPNGGAAKAAAQALHRAEEGGRDAPTGDPFLFPLSYEDAPTADLLRDYGPAFVKLLETAPVGEWSGPVLSPYGWHLVRIEARRQPPAVAFEAVRDQVRDAYLADRRAASNAAFMAGLRKRYRVVVAGVPER